VNWLHVWLPGLQLAFGLIQNLPSLAGICEWLSNVTRDDWSIVKQVQQLAAIPGEDDLLLSSFDGSSEMEVIGLLELLASLVLISRCLQYGVVATRTMLVS